MVTVLRPPWWLDARKSAFGASATVRFTVMLLVGTGLAVKVKVALPPSVTDAVSTAIEIDTTFLKGFMSSADSRASKYAIRFGIVRKIFVSQLRLILDGTYRAAKYARKDSATSSWLGRLFA